MYRSSELGVDVLLAVEMIKHASMKEHDFLALVSSDRDYLPLLSYLKDQGQRVLHVATGEPHRDMRSLSWKQIQLSEQYVRLCSIIHERRWILAIPRRAEELADAESILKERGLGYDIIDITEPKVINDRDLEFLLRNQDVYFRKIGDVRERPFAQQFLYGSLHKLYGSPHEFRKALADGEIEGDLPT